MAIILNIWIDKHTFAEANCPVFCTSLSSLHYYFEEQNLGRSENVITQKLITE